MDKRLLDYDPFTGLIQYIHHDDLTDTTTIETVQDTAQLNKEVEASKDLQNDSSYTQQGMKNVTHHARNRTTFINCSVGANQRKSIFTIVETA